MKLFLREFSQGIGLRLGSKVESLKDRALLPRFQNCWEGGTYFTAA